MKPWQRHSSIQVPCMNQRQRSIHRMTVRRIFSHGPATQFPGRNCDTSAKSPFRFQRPVLKGSVLLTFAPLSCLVYSLYVHNRQKSIFFQLNRQKRSLFARDLFIIYIYLLFLTFKIRTIMGLRTRLMAISMRKLTPTKPKNKKPMKPAASTA